jgi:hypothetical protein
MDDVLLTPTEAARFLGLSVSTLAKARVYATGPVFVKFSKGGVVRYRRSDLEQFVATRRRASTSDDGSGAAAA